VAHGKPIDLGPVPPYFQLKTLLLESILRGEYGAGDRLPTEHELCERHGLSRTPVTRALSELAQEGVLLRHRRRGTFVNPHWLRRPADRAEVRVVVPEGTWETLVRAAASPEIPVNVVTVSRPSLRQTLTHAVAEGQAPDVAVLDSVWLAEFAEARFLYPLEDLDEDWVRTEYEVDFLSPLVAANRYSGLTFGVSAFADVAGLWYRRSELERTGFAPPTTWAELRSVGRAIAANGVAHPVVMPGGSRGGETTVYCLLAFLASNGARVVENGAVTLGSAATAQALRFIRRLVDDGVMSRDVVGYEWNRPIRLLSEEQAAISFGGSYEALVLAEGLGVPLDDLWHHVTFTAMPRGPSGDSASLTGTMVYGIFRQAAQPRLAMRLVKALVEPDELARIAGTTGRIPPRRSAVALAAPALPFLSQTAEMLDTAVTRPATPLYPRVSAQLQAMLEAVLTERLSPGRAAQRTAELIGAITGLDVAKKRATPTL
jgi:multiple sugar transport system substrate-binding protein